MPTHLSPDADAERTMTPYFLFIEIKALALFVKDDTAAKRTVTPYFDY
jgi:hypothetical protein